MTPLRLHLVMHGSHVGYFVVTCKDWDDFLWTWRFPNG